MIPYDYPDCRLCEGTGLGQRPGTICPSCDGLGVQLDNTPDDGGDVTPPDETCGQFYDGR